MKKRMFILTVTALVFMTVIGCTRAPASGSAAGGSTGGAVAQTAAPSTLQKIIQSKKMVIGCILSFPPFGYKDEQGNPQGYDVEIAKLVGKSLGASVEIVDVTADARIPSLQTGKVDLIIGNFTRTLERAQAVDFTNPYIAAGERLLVRKDGGIKQNSDVAGKKVGVTKGSTNADLAKSLWPTANIVYFDTSADALVGLKNKQCDTFLEDSNFQAYQAKLDPNLEVVGDSLISLEYNGFGVKKGDQDWLNYLNLFIFNMNVNGTNKALYRQFFGMDPVYPLNPQY